MAYSTRASTQPDTPEDRERERIPVQNDLNQEGSSGVSKFGKPKLSNTNILLSSDQEFPNLQFANASSEPVKTNHTKTSISKRKETFTMSNVASILNPSTKTEISAKDLPKNDDEPQHTGQVESGSEQASGGCVHMNNPDKPAICETSSTESKDDEKSFLLSIENVNLHYEREDVYDLLDHPFGQILNVQEERCRNKTLKLLIW